MSALYIQEQGAVVSKQGERIIVSSNGEKRIDIPIIKIDNLALRGNVHVTTPALHLLMRNGVDVSYISYSGKYLGGVMADSSKNIFLRYEQFKIFNDVEVRLEFAKQIVRNKIDNQIAIIRRYRRKERKYEWDKDIKRIKSYKK